MESEQVSEIVQVRAFDRRFGIRLRDWRNQRGLASASLGVQLGCSGTYVLNWESGLKPPPDRESAIGRRLYHMEDAPEPPAAVEDFLWAIFGLYRRSLLYFAKLLAAAYVGSDVLPPALGSIWHDVWEDAETCAEVRQRMEALSERTPGPIIDWLMACCTGFTFDFTARTAQTGVQWQAVDSLTQNPEVQDCNNLGLAIMADQKNSRFAPVGDPLYYTGHVVVPMAAESEPATLSYAGRILAQLRYPVPQNSRQPRMRGLTAIQYIPENAWLSPV